MAAIIVASGQTSTGITLNSGDTLTVQGGGTASSTTINSGGSETVLGHDFSASISGGSLFVSSGGMAVATNLTGNGLEVVSAGAIASGTTIQQIGGGGSEIVFGTAISTTLDAGSQTISSGGVASNTTVLGGLLVVASSGTARGAVLSAGSETVLGTDIGAQLIGGQMVVSSGGTASATAVGTTLTVSAGALAVSTTVTSSTAAEFVLGTASATTVSAGSLFISSGGSGVGTVLTGKTLEVVFAGGVASGTVMNQPGNAGTSEIVLGTAIGTSIAAGSQTVMSGGLASNTLLLNSQLIVSSGGTARGTQVSGGSETVLGTDIGAQLIGGQMTVSSGGAVSNAAVGTTLTVSAGGLAVSNTVVSSTAAMFVLGSASATTVSAGSFFVSSGGSTVGTILTGKALDVVFAGGVASGTITEQTGNLGTNEIVLGTEIGALVDAGTVTVSSGGVASATSMAAGTLVIASAGTGLGTKLLGGAETVFGTESGAVVSVPASLTVSSGGVASATNLSGSLTVAAGGRTVGTIINFAGGHETVFGTASTTTMSSGTLVISSGGTAVNTLLTGKAVEIVAAGAVASGTTMEQTGNGGTSETVLGSEVGAIVDAGTMTVSSGGTISNTTLFEGTIVVSGGATGFGTKVQIGREIVLGTESGALISGGGGALIVSSGGVASGTLASGSLVVSSGGLSVSTTLAFGGGGETVLGTASVTTVSGSLIVSSGGTAISSTVGQRSVMTVSSGGTAVSTTLQGQDILELQSGATVSGGVTFAGSGSQLKIDGAVPPQGLVIFGFDQTDTVDLPNIVFDASGNAVIEPGNVLQVTENGSSLNLQLDPNQAFPSGTTFLLTKDTGSGTLLTLGNPSAIKLITLGSTPQTVVGAAGDTIVGGSGSAVINAVAGPETVTGGSGATSVFGGFEDSITAGSGPTYIDGSLGDMAITVGAPGGSDTIIGSVSPALGAGPDTLSGGGANVLIEALGRGDIVSFANETGTAVINATGGGNTITLGSAAASVFGAANSTITLGSGAATLLAGVGSKIVLGSGPQIVAQLNGAGAVTVGGAGGSDTIIGSVFQNSGVGADTLTGGAATVIVSSLGRGDIVNFAGQTGTAVINALGLAGADSITLGSGAASVFGGGADTINFGTGNQYADLSGAPGATVKLGFAGIDSIAGSTLAGPATTIKGGAASLVYNTGGGSDLIDLTGTSGTAVINGFGADTRSVNDTIIAGNGATSVWGGQGNRIGVGAAATGNDLFTHATTINGASIGFGTNGTAANSSTAKVTVSGFAETGGTATDYLFYQGENPGATKSIVTGSTQVTVNGTASTVLTLPDGTVMTLVGVANADFGVSFFK